MRRHDVWVVLLGLAIIFLHFRGLLASPMNDVIWGISLSEDPLGDVALLNRILREVRNGCLGRDATVSFPFGEEIFYSINWFLTPSFIVAFALTGLTGKAVFSFNAAIMIMFFLNLIFSYRALLLLFDDWVSALVPAVLMTFSTYSYAHSWAHLGLLPLFYFPWFLVSLVRFLESGQWRFGIVAAITVAASLYCSPYYTYFIFWMAVAIFLGHVMIDHRRYLNIRSLLRLAGAAAISVVVALPYFYWNFFRDYSDLWQAAPASASYGDNMTHLMSFSARPSDYILPNVNNFWFGEYFAPLVSDQMPLRGAWSDELPIYIGVLPTLAILGLLVALVVPAWRRWLFAERSALVMSLLLIMLASFFISLAPELKIADFTIPMPNSILRRLLPFRSYSRFAIVFLFALAVLIVSIARRTQWRQWAAIGLIGCCIFESMPKTKLFYASKEIPYIKFLRDRPEKVVMRFEQNLGRRLIIERELINKISLNGAVNNRYGMTDQILLKNLPRLNMGHLGQMGAELLIVNGHLQMTEENAKYLEKIYDSGGEQIEIWKIRPGDDPRIAALYQPLIEKRQADSCFVVKKNEAEEIMQRLIALLAS